MTLFREIYATICCGFKSRHEGQDSRPLAVGEQKTKLLASPTVTAKLCKVSCRDAAGAEHSVEITARSLYEAVGRALEILRAHEWVDGVGRNWALTVAVKNPEVTHSVRLADFENWLEGSGKSPAEQALKVELRALLPNGKTSAREK